MDLKVYIKRDIKISNNTNIMKTLKIIKNIVIYNVSFPFDPYF